MLEQSQGCLRKFHVFKPVLSPGTIEAYLNLGAAKVIPDPLGLVFEAKRITSLVLVCLLYLCTLSATFLSLMLSL